MEVALWISAGLLLILYTTARSILSSVRQQKESFDLTVYLLLRERLVTAWQSHRNAVDSPLHGAESVFAQRAAREEEELTLLELASVLELSCRLYNDRALGPTSRALLANDIRQFLLQVMDHPMLERVLRRRGRDAVFGTHMRRFARANGIARAAQ